MATVSCPVFRRGIWREISNDWAFLAGVWCVELERWTVPLCRGKSTRHGPDDLIISPCPTQFPTRFINMTIMIVILNCYPCLQAKDKQWMMNTPKWNSRVPESYYCCKTVGCPKYWKISKVNFSFFLELISSVSAFFFVMNSYSWSDGKWHTDHIAISCPLINVKSNCNVPIGIQRIIAICKTSKMCT